MLLRELGEALVRSGRAREASCGPNRASVVGLAAGEEARVVAAVLAELFAGRTAPAEQLLALLPPSGTKQG